MASQHTKELIAQQAAGGYTTRELADMHNYTYQGMRTLLRTDSMQKRISEYQLEYMGGAQRGLFRWLMHSESIHSGMLDMALDPAHPKQFDAAKFVLDKLHPQRTAGTVDVNTTVGISSEVLELLTDKLEGSRKAMDSGTMQLPKLVPGKDALPSLEDAPPTPAAKPTLSKEDKIREARESDPNDSRYKGPNGSKGPDGVTH
jgi:hypothetical protein